MSSHQNPTEGVVACVALPGTETPGATTCGAQPHWRQERLLEARGILADIAHHPDTLVVLACRVVCGCSTDAEECADALGVMRLLNARTPELASTAPKGGAA